MRVLLNEAAGNFSTSKKSGERRWASRWASPVSMLAGSMVTSTEEAAGFLGSKTSLPLHLAKRPRVLETTMWRTAKWMAEWVGSMFQLLVATIVTSKRGVTSFSEATDAFVRNGIRP